MVQGLSILKNLFDWVIAIINGDWTGALNAARGACDSLVSAVMGIADSLGIGDAIRAAFDDVVNFLNSIDLSECGRKILETLKNGILSAAGSIRDAVSGVFDKIGSLLPHSDAKEGPLSTLTLSGQKMMTTLAGGEGCHQPSPEALPSEPAPCRGRSAVPSSRLDRTSAQL